MVRGKVQLQLPRKKKGDIHIPLAVHTLSSKDCREEFQQSLCQLLLQHPHCVGDQPEDNWGRLKMCIVESAEECLGRARKRQPDWFLDAIDTVMLLVTAKRRAYCRFLHAHTTSSKKELDNIRGLSRRPWMRQRRRESTESSGRWSVRGRMGSRDG